MPGRERVSHAQDPAMKLLASGIPGSNSDSAVSLLLLHPTDGLVSIPLLSVSIPLLTPPTRATKTQILRPPSTLSSVVYHIG